MKPIINIQDIEIRDFARAIQLMAELGYSSNSAEFETRMKNIYNNSNYFTLVAVKAKEVYGIWG